MTKKQKHLYKLLRQYKEKAKKQILLQYARLTKKTLYWDYSINGDDYDQRDFLVYEMAVQASEDHWEESCAGDGCYRNGEVVLADVTYIQYFYDHNENQVIVNTKEDCLEYEHYHGDYAEHFNMRDYF